MPHQQADGKGPAQQVVREVKPEEPDATQAQEAAADVGIAGDGRFDETTQQYYTQQGRQRQEQQRQQKQRQKGAEGAADSTRLYGGGSMAQ